MEQRTCTKCKITKPLDLFAKSKKGNQGRCSWCKKCHCNATKKWKSENQEAVNKTMKAYYKSDHGRFVTAKKNARKRNLKWSITFDEFEELISDECFYCNGSLGTNKSMGSGLDRVNNDLGYIYDNVVPCCSICNKIKNNFLTLDETLVAVESIINLRRKNHGE